MLIFFYLRSCEIGNDQLGFLQVKENSHGNNVMVLIRNSGSLIVFLWFLGKRQGYKVQLAAERNRDLCSFHEHNWDQRSLPGGISSLMRHTELRMRSLRYVSTKCGGHILLLWFNTMFLILFPALRNCVRTPFLKSVAPDRNFFAEQSSWAVVIDELSIARCF